MQAAWGSGCLGGADAEDRAVASVTLENLDAYQNPAAPRPRKTLAAA